MSTTRTAFLTIVFFLGVLAFLHLLRKSRAPVAAFLNKLNQNESRACLLEHRCAKFVEIPGLGWMRNAELHSGAPAFKEPELLEPNLREANQIETQLMQNLHSTYKEVMTDRPKRQLGILDPLFNIREVIKNLLLLEQHLFVPSQRCVQCIRKHTLLIEAFLDEAYSLDKTLEYADVLQKAKQALSQITDRVCDLTPPKHDDVDASENRNVIFNDLGQMVRDMRKPLTQELFKHL